MTIDFKIWNMQGVGVTLQCLACHTTFGIEHFDHIIRLWDGSVFALEDIKDDDNLKCPTCTRSITGAVLKSILSDEVDEDVPQVQADPDALEGLMFLEDLLGEAFGDASEEEATEDKLEEGPGEVMPEE